MLISDQFVKVKWNGNNRGIYERKGYIFTEYGVDFLVHIKDLAVNSNIEVRYLCNFCGKEELKGYHLINRKGRSKRTFCDRECSERYQNHGMTQNERVDFSLELLMYLYNKFHCVPTVKIYDDLARKEGALQRRNLEIQLQMKWSEICTEYFNDVNVKRKNKEQLLEEIEQLKEKLGRAPMAIELPLYGLSEKKTYMRAFQMTYNEIIESRGWELSSPKLNYKSPDEMLDDYQMLYKKLGRLPYYVDIDQEEKMCRGTTYKKNFGELKNIWEILDIDYKKEISDLKLGSGFTSIDNNNEICRSYSEMIITNILISQNINYIKEYPYRQLINNLRNRYVMDWYLIDHQIILEFFGLYHSRYRDREDRLGRYTRKVEHKINLCKENGIKLIPIFPEEIVHNDYKVVTEKLKRYRVI